MHGTLHHLHEYCWQVLCAMQDSGNAHYSCTQVYVSSVSPLLASHDSTDSACCCCMIVFCATTNLSPTMNWHMHRKNNDIYMLCWCVWRVIHRTRMHYYNILACVVFAGLANTKTAVQMYKQLYALSTSCNLIYMRLHVNSCETRLTYNIQFVIVTCA